ncbi:MAG TPA: S9 family peptidase [Planctomycetota bacterium]|nr:S9 family peptidase [Planctomycetota bacterium]
MRPAIVITILTAAPAFGTPSHEAPALRRPAALRTEEVPELPDALFEELHRYQEVRSAGFDDWHPAGGVIFSSRIGNISQLYHAREPEGAPVQLTAGLEPVTHGRALPDGSIVVPMARGGDENYQVYRLERPGAEPRLLTDGKSRNLLGPIDREGRRIAFTSTKRNGRDADVHVLHPASGAVDLLLEVNNETWSVEDWSHDGSEVLLSRYVSANESYGFLFELASRKRSPLPPENEAAALPAATVRRSFLRFGPGSRSIYVVSDARGEHRELARIDRGTGRHAWLTRDLASDVEDLELSPDGKLAAFTINAEGWSRLFLLDLGRLERESEAAAREARTEVDLGRAIASGLKFSSDSARLGFTLGGAARPPEAFSIALPSGKPLRWTRSTLGGFDTRDFVEPEAFRYTSFDGRRIPALIFRPPPAKADGGAEKKTAKVPVIVSIHGGPESQSRPTFHAFRQYLVRELGAAVITPNVRGSTGYGKTYARLDNGILREESVRDIGALLDWIAAEESLDASRVAVMGGSYGGYMTLASLVHFGERIRAGVDVVGISNFRTFLENTSPYRRELRRAEYGDERDPSIRAYLEKIAPANHVEKLRSALLVIHGDNDPRVPLSEAEKIAAGARASGKPVWTLYASNEGHGFTRRENRDYEEAVTAAFLKRHLQGGEKVGAKPVGAELPLEAVELGITCRAPRPIDVAAWVRAAKEAGAGYLVLPAEAFMTLGLRLRLGSHTDLPGKAAGADADVLLREIQDAVARPGPLAGLWIEGADEASRRLGVDAALARVHAPRAAVVLGNDGSVALGRNTGPHLESRASLRSGPSPHDGPE